ncbi:MAG: aminotransferase class I/II-fold pyridoxal phosphate-dependent enzyme [Thermodesulfobacteriota bacterium]
MLKGVLKKIAWVDLTQKTVTIEKPDENLYLDYLGGYGLGAYYLYTRQQADADPLGPENTLGFLTGPLTGTNAVAGNRFTVVGKSPKTGGWGDANCGGQFGPALKQAGFDGMFFTGISENPVYILINNGNITLQNAKDYWGLGCCATEDKLKNKYGKKAHSVCIGQAGERASLLSAIITDQGRAAARSGLGAVMGSKKIKALVAMAGGNVEAADETNLKKLRQKILKDFKSDNELYKLFNTYGTPALLEPLVLEGDAPVKNWSGWDKDMPGLEKIGGEAVKKIQKRPYGCWRCPIACGGHVQVETGPYAGKGHKPEYETLGAFGTMCLNDNLESICRLNNICNDAGMDTISAGSTVAFAIECYENGIITKEDTSGIELTWGNHEAIVAVTEQMASGHGFGGKVLGDGIKKAVELIGGKAREFAMECGGEELPMHDPRCFPGIAASYEADATPSRHTQDGSWGAEDGDPPPEGLECPPIKDKYTYKGKGETHKYLSAFGHVINASGMCQIASWMMPAPAVWKFLTFTMGKNMTRENILQIGERIAALRIMFNLREGIHTRNKFKLPPRVLGNPPLSGGATKGVTVDNETQLQDYYKAMGWDSKTGIPSRKALKKLGLDFVIKNKSIKLDPASTLQDTMHLDPATNGVNQPVTDSATYAFDSGDDMLDCFHGEKEAFLYSRHWNPTNLELSKALAAIEGTESAWVTGSGMAAITSALLQLLKTGDHIVTSVTTYGGTYAFLKNWVTQYGIEVSFVNIADLDEVKKAVRPNTKVIYTETVTNPMLQISDIPELSKIAKNAGAKLVVDNTFTPMIFSPIKLGADIVVYSMTKFINGKNDCTAGAILGPADYINSLIDVNDGTAMLLGPVLDPMRASSIHKNLFTLHIRMKQHSKNAAFLAKKFVEHKIIVNYPGLEAHKQHNIMKRDMNEGFGFGGMIAIDLKTVENANKFMHIMQERGVGYLAVSLGYFKTLFSNSGKSTSSEISEDVQKEMGMSEGLVRYSVGLDNNIERTWNIIKECLQEIKFI